MLTLLIGTAPHSDSATISSEVAVSMEDREDEKALIPVPHSTAMRSMSSLQESCDQVCFLAGNGFSFILQQFLQLGNGH